jgi:hypothetical protein
MAWQDQGRHEHGWFGHGHAFGLQGDSNVADRAELRARAFATFEFAMEDLRGESGQATLPHWQTRDALRELVPRWAENAGKPATVFRERYFDAAADPLDAWAMQRATLAICGADSLAGLKDAGVELAGAMKVVGLSKLPACLQAARSRAALSQAASASAIQRVATIVPEEEREEECNAEKPLLPLLPLHVPVTPGTEGPSGGQGPLMGGAAVFSGDKALASAAGIVRQPTSGQRSERYYGTMLSDDHPPQLSYLAGRQVGYGTTGSVRPDFVSPDGKTASFEVKNYDITNNRSSRLINDVVKQVLRRATNLPEGMKQKVAIDITGQSVTIERQ